MPTDDAIIDRKFKFSAINPVNGKTYSEKNAIVFCAKDRALLPTLRAYQIECMRIGANTEHVQSIGLLMQRVADYQRDVESKIPDTVGDEVPRVLYGTGL